MKPKLKEPRFVAKVACRFIFCSGLLNGLSGHAEDLIKRVEGRYTAPANNCSDLQEGKLVSCEDIERDCLSIQKIDDSTVKIEIRSVQTNLNDCEVRGEAKIERGKLIYVGDDNDAQTKKSRFGIELKDGKITFHYLSETDRSQNPFCGPRADLEIAAFFIKDKVKQDGKSCM